MTDENMPMEHFDKYKEVTSLLESCFRKFRQAPSNKEAQSIVALLSSRLKLKEVMTYLDGLHLKHQTFPFMGQIEKDVALIERARKFQYIEKPQAIRQKEPPWISAQAAGTPAQAEALFNLIKKGLTSSYRFTVARTRKWAKELTDEQLWDCYSYWTEGKVHPLISGYKDPFA